MKRTTSFWNEKGKGRIREKEGEEKRNDKRKGRRKET